MEGENHCKHVLDYPDPLESKGKGSCALYVKVARGGQTRVSPGSKTAGKSNFILGTKALALGKVESGDLKRKQLFWNQFLFYRLCIGFCCWRDSDSRAEQASRAGGLCSVPQAEQPDGGVLPGPRRTCCLRSTASKQSVLHYTGASQVSLTWGVEMTLPQYIVMI